MVTEDLILLTKNLAFLPCSFISSKASDKEFRDEYSEMSIARGLKSKINLLKVVAFGSQSKQKPQIIHWYKAGTQTDAEWFFINGVCTTRELAELNIAAISELFGVRVTALYNPTDGFVKDILECIHERTFDKYAGITEELFDRVLNVINAGKSVKIIAHSQGGIIASNLLKMLKSLNSSFDIELFTFASAADEDVPVSGVYQEHFCNEFDFVARMGILNEVTSGARYTKAKAAGHFLNRDYLEHFKQAKYCNGNSRLYSYLK
jgi:hypothetical protein